MKGLGYWPAACPTYSAGNVTLVHRCWIQSGYGSCQRWVSSWGLGLCEQHRMELIESTNEA